MINLKTFQNPKVYRVVWCLLICWILWQCTAAIRRSTLLPKRVQQALEDYKESSEKSTQTHAPKNNDRHKLKSLFVKQKKPQMPTCTAVLGAEALINNQWHKVGGNADGAKILEISPESVKILWEEKEHILVPFGVKVKNPGQNNNGQPPSGQKETPDSPTPNERDAENAENKKSPEEQKATRRQMR